MIVFFFCLHKILNNKGLEFSKHVYSYVLLRCLKDLSRILFLLSAKIVLSNVCIHSHWVFLDVRCSFFNDDNSSTSNHHYTRLNIARHYAIASDHVGHRKLAQTASFVLVSRVADGMSYWLIIVYLNYKGARLHGRFAN